MSLGHILESSVTHDNPRLNQTCYKLVKADSMSNNKRDGVVLLKNPSRFKECLLLKVFAENKKRICIIIL